ncbi:IGR protein motif-domain-containing protein [Aspergillus cavernicola]|uniref:Small ribosomal subunit protein mS41 n=1 Tax=Aspergillus cavernicola TaxID=176166 RepID=A0ABR4J395_9EURO
MAMRNPFSFLRTIRPFQLTRQCLRTMHKKSAPPSVPQTTPFVPNVETFLTLIGRDMAKHSSKLPSWEKLFTLNSSELRDLGIEPTRQRRYLLRKREKFRQGIYGPGGDLEHVVDGVAQLRVTEVPSEASVKNSKVGDIDATNLLDFSATLSPGMRRVIVNLPPDATEYKHNPSKSLKKFAQMKIHRGLLLKGPFLQPIKGTNGSAALIKVQEGMWEDKLGHKVDGGERRRAEVRAKKRAEERRKGLP